MHLHAREARHLSFDGSDKGVYSLRYFTSVPGPPSINEAERLELAARIERIRRLCEHLDTALNGASQQRELIVKMKLEADALRASLHIHKNRFETS